MLNLSMFPTARVVGAALVAASSLFGAGAYAAGPELVTNGGFETGDFTGYTVVSTATSLIGVDSLGPHNGDDSAFFGSIDRPDTISQSLATTAGTTYAVSFFLDSTMTTGAASFIGTFGDTVFIDLSGADAGFAFRPFVYDVVATASTTVLSFAAYNNNGFYTLDDVSVQATGAPVTAVPEPSSLALMALGLASVGWALRRGRSASAGTATA